MKKIIICLSMLASMITQVGAASTQEISAQISLVKQQQEKAHQIAEYVRKFGESENHPAIQFAKQKWTENQELLTKLLSQYDAAEKAEQERNSKGTYIGRFRISHYCPCSSCNGGYQGTAVGAPLTPWYTVAVDPYVIPLNRTVYIDGYGKFRAQDTGSAIRGNRIDVCVSSHSEAMRLGIIYKDVYLS